jgi:3-oxoacyl-(acyl-carrier-protein) synthase
VETALNKPRVAIAGVGAVTALGSGIEPLRQALLANTSGLRPRVYLVGKKPQSIVTGFVPEETLAQLRNDDLDHGDSRVFLFARAGLKQAVQSIAHPSLFPKPAGAGVTRRAIQQPQSFLTPSPANTSEPPLLNCVPPARRGFVLSTTKANIEALERLIHRQPCSAAAQRQIQPARLAADLALACDARGPVQCVSAACISGLLAIQQGVALIRRRLADLVFLAGVDLISEFVLAGFTSLKSLDPEGCRPFDRARLGLSLGEGAGALVLVRRDLLSSPAVVVSGWGTSNDANHLTGPSRDGAGLALAISRALAKAGLAPDAIDYVNAHGTGTPYNDNMESLALRTVFGERVPPFSSSKGMLGHTLGAAGILETVLCLAAMETRLLPGTPRLRQRDPVVPESLLDTPRPASRLERILKINCGFGGTNGALVLERDSE